MTDRYTKAVLTIIAGALVVLAAENAVGPAEAAPPVGCGSTASYPCYVATDPRVGLAVTNVFAYGANGGALRVTGP